jgi:hypothetical protein
MKIGTIAFLSAFALSSTFALATFALSSGFALATTSHHQTGHHKYRTHHGTVGMSSARTPGGSMNGGAGGSNNRGGLVGGSEPGTYKP